MSYVLICALRRIGLKHTQFASASCGTFRLKLLRIGALVRTSVRRIKLAIPSAFAYQAEYNAAHIALTAAASARRTRRGSANNPGSTNRLTVPPRPRKSCTSSLQPITAIIPAAPPFIRNLSIEAKHHPQSVRRSVAMVPGCVPTRSPHHRLL
jgi:hypothetical protein